MPEIRPKQFDDLAAFTARCERALEVDPEALILFGHTRRLKRARIRMTREGPEAIVVGWDVEASLTVLEVKASAVLAVIRAGHFVDRFDLTLSQTEAHAVPRQGPTL